MKPIIVSFLLFVAPGLILAQTITLSGTVADGNGVPLRYAFILDKQTKNATYTDSLGGFNLTVNPASQILISCKGYKKDSVNVEGKNRFDIILKADPAYNRNAANTDNDVSKLQQAFKTRNAEFTGPQLAMGGGTAFTNIKETVGSRFLFDRWVHGYTIKVNGQLLQDPETLYNYDKIRGNLFITPDLKSVLVADKNKVQYFVLFSPQGQKFTFERMMGISDSLYSQVISDGPRYKIYKLITMKFIPSHYETDGVVSTGNLYDEYADVNTFFIMNVTTTAFQPLKLTKKGLMEAFTDDHDKIAPYIATHKGEIDEAYLKKLGDAMNQ